MSGVAARFHGLDEVRHDLRELAHDLPDALRKADQDAAEETAERARSAAYSLGGVAAHVAPSLKAAGREVSLGGSGYDMAAGAEFGSRRYRQFKPWRGSGDSGGYFLYPTISRDADRIEGTYADALDDLLRRNGLA